MEIEKKLEALGLALPAAMQVAPDVRLPFKPVRVRGNRALVSGNGPLAPDGSVAGQFGKVGAEVTLEQAKPEARVWRPRPHHGVAARLRHGQRRAGLHADARRHQRLFGSDPRTIRARD